MSARALLMALLLAGCATQAPVPPPAGDVAGIRGPEAQFRAERPTLRRVGYRNCNGYSMELLVPRHVARDPRGQGIWWQITPYLPGRAGSYQISLPENFDMPGWRTQRRSGNGWLTLERPAAADRRDAPRRVVFSAADLGPSLPIRLDLAAAIGVPAEQLSPGSYRVQAADFIVETASGGRCAMRPFWVFDIQ